MHFEFILLRPWWLLALPLLGYAIWRSSGSSDGGGPWTRYVSEPLQTLVLTSGAPGRRGLRTAPLALAGLLAVAALSGPSWQRRPQPLFQGDSGLVIVLDLSRAMLVTDIQPTRLERAKRKIHELLLRKPADQLGLVVYAAAAFDATPLTTDARNIDLLLPVLHPDLMPEEGQSTADALSEAAEMLQRAGVRQGRLLLLTAQFDPASTIRTARTLAARGYKTSVLAIGTRAGAPLPSRAGNATVDGGSGTALISRLDLDVIKELAAVGGGRATTSTSGSHDLDYLLQTSPENGAAASPSHRTRALWVDEGPWLVIGLLPLALLGFRYGMIPGLLLVCLLSAPAARAGDGILPRVFLRSDQQGMAALRRNDPERASRLFADPEWRALALYRAGHFLESAAALNQLDTPEANYNRGNALVMAGKLKAALDAYRQTLNLDPRHRDALHNYAVVSHLIARSGEETDEEDSHQSRSTDIDAEEESQHWSQRAESGSKSGQPQPNATPQQQKMQGGKPNASVTPPHGASSVSQLQLAAADSPEARQHALREVPDDPGGLLRRKFQYEALQRQQRAGQSAAEAPHPP
jgi:Ca-activated chloride channel homolog